MRNNQPVTGREYPLRDDHFLISRTDLKGRITYANPAFVEVSGFSREELLGAPHNIVRHPDMPVQAFGNLWSTIAAGHTWMGVIRNRRRNGDHYWVRSHVTPVVEGGRTTGYVSVRLKASAAEIRDAERDYALLREGRGRHLVLHRGEVRQRGLTGMLRRFNRRALEVRLAGLALVSCTLLGVSTGIGLYGLWQSGEVLSRPLLVAHGAVMVVGLLLMIGLCVRLTRQLLRPVSDAVQFTLQIAAGNLGARLAGEAHHGNNRLRRALDVMRRSLASIVGDVNEGLDVVAPAARSIAEGNEDLSSRSEQQAASLQQTAASMEQITTTVRQNADNARQASLLASEAATTVAGSREVMGQVVDTMGRITTSSEKMSVIIDAIDNIAFQTNILALNASVEAARAGEQGRGFAVVAGEVRSLAGRSAEAAREIRELIARSGEEIDAGAQLVRRAEGTMEGVVSSVTRVNDIIGEISAASEEQSTGISQVNRAITQMDEVTRQNAERVGASARAASALQERVGILGGAMGVFRLESEPSSPPARRTPTLTVINATAEKAS